MNSNKDVDFQYALDECREGRVSDHLKKLYNMPYRELVPWCMFPAWARPNDETEGCHEG
jgi:hypothetical protein